MSQLISGIMGFIRTAITASLIGLGVLLLTGEVRLAAFKMACCHGTSKLSKFTKRMTKV